MSRVVVWQRVPDGWAITPVADPPPAPTQGPRAPKREVGRASDPVIRLLRENPLGLTTRELVRRIGPSVRSENNLRVLIHYLRHKHGFPIRSFKVDGRVVYRLDTEKGP